MGIFLYVSTWVKTNHLFHYFVGELCSHLGLATPKTAVTGLRNNKQANVVFSPISEMLRRLAQLTWVGTKFEKL